MRLQVEELNNAVGTTNIKNILKHLPRSLDEFHDKALSRISNFEKNSRREAFDILSWIYYAKRPLRMNELLAAVSRVDVVKDSSMGSEEHLPYNIEKLCEGLAEYDTDSGIVGFTHSTVQEFFKNRLCSVAAKPDPCFTDNFLSNVDSAMVCLNCIGSVDFRECKPSNLLEGYEGYYDYLTALLQQTTFLRYSVRFWSHHVREAEQSEAVQQAFFHVFASKNTRIGIHEVKEITRSKIGSFFIPANYSLLHFAAENGLGKIVEISLETG